MRLFGNLFLAALLAATGTGISIPKEEKFSLEAFLKEREDLVFYQTVDVSYGTVYQFHQEYRGTEVYGASYTVSTDKAGHVLSVNDCTSEISSLAKEKITEEQAAEKALSFGGKIVGCRQVIDPETSEICYDFTTTAQGGERILVSSVSGEAVSISPTSCLATVPIKQVNVYGEEVELPIEREEENGETLYYLSDEIKNIYCYDAHSSEMTADFYVNNTGIFDDRMAVTVYDTILKSYNFYADEKNVGTSWKGLGGNNDDIEENYEEAGEIPLLVLVHYGNKYENANCGYDPQQKVAYMYVGDGSPNGMLYQQGKAVDVIAHEYQHAVTELLSPSGLIYLNETGAINECISDVFGALVEGHELTDEEFWAIGEDAVPASRGDVIRSLKQPSGVNVMHMKDEGPLCMERHNHENFGCDNGSVHGNSTILSHAQYRMWQKMPEFFTRERIGQLWFSTVATISYQCDFEEFATQMLEAAEHLGYGEEEIGVIRETFFESGVLGEPVKTHVVTYMDGRNKVEMITVRDGQAAYAPTLQERIVEAGKYVFKGWDKDLSNVKEDVVTQAIFEVELNKFTVNFSVDGKVVLSEVVEYGKSATPPDEVPTKAGNEREEYEFERWDASLDNVTSDRTINAIFKSIPMMYDVVFVSDGTEIARMQVQYGKGATAPDETPKRASDAQYDYIFDGWDTNFDEITASTTVNAVFRQELRKYSVKFMDGSTVKAEGFWHYGEEVTMSPLTDESRTFEGWYLDEGLTRRAEGLKIEGDVVLYAKWEGGSKNLALIVGVSVGVVLVVAGGVAAVLVMRKKKRGE